MRILVVEDDEALGAVLARGLRRQGYVVDLVPDGETAASYLTFYEYTAAVTRLSRVAGAGALPGVHSAGYGPRRTPAPRRRDSPRPG